MVAYTLYHAMEACGIPVDETMDNEFPFSRRLNSLACCRMSFRAESFLAACFQRAEQKIPHFGTGGSKPQLSICKITIRRISPFRRWRPGSYQRFLFQPVVPGVYRDTLVDYLTKLRINKRAIDYMKNSDYTIEAIACMVGF